MRQGNVCFFFPPFLHLCFFICSIFITFLSFFFPSFSLTFLPFVVSFFFFLFSSSVSFPISFISLFLPSNAAFFTPFSCYTHVCGIELFKEKRKKLLQLEEKYTSIVWTGTRCTVAFQSVAMVLVGFQQICSSPLRYEY